MQADDCGDAGRGAGACLGTGRAWKGTLHWTGKYDGSPEQHCRQAEGSSIRQKSVLSSARTHSPSTQVPSALLLPGPLQYPSWDDLDSLKSCCNKVSLTPDWSDLAHGMIQELDSTPASGSLQVRESPMDTTFNINIDMAMGLCAPAFRSLSRQISPYLCMRKALQQARRTRMTPSCSPARLPLHLFCSNNTIMLRRMDSSMPSKFTPCSCCLY